MGYCVRHPPRRWYLGPGLCVVPGFNSTIDYISGEGFYLLRGGNWAILIWA